MHLRTTRLGLESLEDRLAPACVVNVVGDTLNITGDTANDVVIVRDDGLGNINGDASGTAFSASGIRNINIITEGGNDDVQYNLVGNMAAHQWRYVVIGLGSNNDPTSLHDRFIGNLYGNDIGAGASLVINAGGGFGNDELVMRAFGTDVAAGARLKTTFDGGYGNDIVMQSYQGINNGSLAFRSHGNLGNDTFRQLMRVTAGTGATASVVNGGDGNDIMSSELYLPAGKVPAPGSYVDGGTGTDTANVNADMIFPWMLPISAETVNIL